jgi:hypothetical protein
MVRNRAAPGKIRNIGSVVVQSMAAAMVPPQLGVGGGTPAPRNDSAASRPMKVGMLTVATAMIGPHRLGSRSAARTCRGPAPNERAAATNPRVLSDSVWARTTRAVTGQPNTAMMRISSKGRGNAGGASAPTAIMKISQGNPSRKLMTQLATWSAQPPRYPAARPTSTPIATATAVATVPISSDIRAP